jgi:N-acetyl-alpha-D-muramate 1-phosphate uridylyltransferase
MNNIPKGSKALIFAAGLGTRLKPFTDFHPKALAIVNGKPLLQRNLEYLQSYGINDFVINVHHFANQITNFLEANDNFGARISISHEIDQPLETGGGLLFAREFLQEATAPFITMNADILTDLNIGEMYTNHLAKNPLVSLAVTNRKSSRKLLFNQELQLCGWENTKTGEQRISRYQNTLSPKAFSGVHIIEPSLFYLITQKGVFSIIDTYLELAKNHTILGYEHSNDLVVDVGKPESIFEAEKHFK